MLTALLLLMALPGQPSPMQVHDGGVCIGLAWVTVGPGETVTDTYGPDFDIYRFSGPPGSESGAWSVYAGNAANATPTGDVLLARDGVTIRAAFQQGRYVGWLAQKGRAQSHFFGPLFTGTPADKHFFDRIDFGPAGQASCARWR